MLEITYFRAELVQLIVSRRDSELEVQRYSTKKNTLAVDPIMLQDELWMGQREKPSPIRRSRFFENRIAETEYSFFWILRSARFLENRYPKFSSDSAHPYKLKLYATVKLRYSCSAFVISVVHPLDADCHFQFTTVTSICNQTEMLHTVT